MVSANCSRMKIAKATYHVRRSDVSAYVTLVKTSVVLIACSNKLGAVRRMRTRIRLLAQPESMRSIVGATQQEQRFD